MLIRGYPELSLPVESRLGQLQRGLGRGMIAALACESEAELEALSIELTYLVLNDPRADTQCEQRSEYFAEIYHRSGATLAPVIEALKSRWAFPDQEHEDWLLADVLEEMLALGDESAAEAMRELLGNRYTFYLALRPLQGLTEERAREVMPAAQVQAWMAKQSREELIESIEIGLEYEDVRWELWCDEVPELRSALDEASDEDEEPGSEEPTRGDSGLALSAAHSDAAPSKAEYAQMPTAELMHHASKLDWAWLQKQLRHRVASGQREEVEAACLANLHHESVMIQRVVFETLGECGCTSVLDAMLRRLFEIEALYIDFNERLKHAAPNDCVTLSVPRDMRGVVRYFERVNDPEVARLARTWLGREHPVGTVAMDVLSTTASADDAELLRAEVDRCMAENDSGWGLYTLAEGCVRTGDDSLIEHLLELYPQLRYANARQKILHVMVEHGLRDRIVPLLIEALWDCEDLARTLAIEHAPLDAPGVRERIEEIANASSFWNEEHSRWRTRVRSAARERLGMPDESKEQSDE